MEVVVLAMSRANATGAIGPAQQRALSRLLHRAQYLLGQVPFQAYYEKPWGFVHLVK